ncbi:MAG: hypothetical protein JSV34_05000 [Candidatus Omnitrophota bacterium]|nr:MAG: hypothetical protein JSV34_05000 [Candidatus Omnitrophota bacterium]
MELLLWIGVYVYFAFALQTIANKTNARNSWLAWIPVANIYLMCGIAGKPWWWLLLMFIPIVNLVIVVLLFMEIAKARGKDNWLGILMLAPIVNLVVIGYLAFSD